MNTTNVLQYLEASAQRVPNKTVFTDEQKSITFGQLQDEAQRIGSCLIKKTNGTRHRPVVIFVDRNVDSLVAFMGIAYSGHFYVPIELQMPLPQIQTIFNTLNPVAVLSIGSQRELIEKIEGSFMVIDIEEARGYEILSDELAVVRRKTIDTDPLYSTFTSGSTGTPKGVITCHRNVTDLIEDLASTFGFDENTVFGNQNPFYFDASIKDIYCTLKCGATMHIIPRSCFVLPAQLVSFMNDNKVNAIMWSAAAIGIIANTKAFDDGAPKYLKKVMFSGEVMHNKVLNYWRRNLGDDCMFVNLYGPTEITSVCTYYIVDRPYEDDEVLPIGCGFNNTEILLLDEQNHLVEDADVIGELCVRGSCLAMGYYNNPEKTSAAFVQNPLNTAFPEVIYRTGDLAKYDKDGHIIFLSRKDNQVKHMGHRVELGDIEIYVNSLEKIEASFCFYDHDKQKIVLVFSGAADRKYIMDEMKERFPKYMYPNLFIKMEVMPYNLNGKIDRTLLKKKYAEGELK